MTGMGDWLLRLRMRPRFKFYFTRATLPELSCLIIARHAGSPRAAEAAH
jgi:hypothetical protein